LNVGRNRNTSGRIFACPKHIPPANQVEQIPQDNDNSANCARCVFVASHRSDNFNDAVRGYLIQEKVTEARQHMNTQDNLIRLPAPFVGFHEGQIPLFNKDAQGRN
jgi:hypothetical protein